MTPLRSSLPNDPEDDNMEIDTVHVPNVGGITPANFKLSSKDRNETPEEKKARRKMERRRRTSFKSGPDNNTPCLRGALLKQFSKIFDTESAFVLGVQQALPEVRNPHLHPDEDENMDNFLLEDESDKKTAAKRKKFLAKMESNMKKDAKTTADEQSQPPQSYEYLKERLHAKIAALSQKKNEKKRLRKLKKAEFKKQEESSDKKKKFISKANPNLKNQQRGESSAVIKDEKTVPAPKTPLRKKPVVKSNGEIVYSKFDFISQDDPATKKIRPKAEDLLKKVQKSASTVSHLESKGKIKEAVSIVEVQKWDSALKRAQGEKIRDDATLLKKTIKTQEKRKKVSKKKWEERTERVDKEKVAKQDKRKANIQARKDEKVKKTKKQLRKKGRIA